MVDEPAPGMEDVVHHWEVSQKTLMPFKELHEVQDRFQDGASLCQVPSFWESLELYVAGCPACDATRIGKRSTGVHHTPACRERMERLLHAEEGNLRVAQHTAKADAEITGQKQEVSEECTKILYGNSSERPQGAPQDFKVFARLDKQARYMKGTLPEGPNWDQVWWRETRELKTGNIIKSEPFWTHRSKFRRRSRQRTVDWRHGQRYWTVVFTHRWGSAKSTHGWCPPSCDTSGSCRAGEAFCRGKSELSRCFCQAGRRRTTRRKIWEKTRDVTNEGSEKTCGIRRRNVKVQGQPSCFSSGVQGHQKTSWKRKTRWHWPMSHEPDHRRSGQVPSVHWRWKANPFVKRRFLWTGRWSSHMVLLRWYQWKSFGHQRCWKSKKRWGWNHRKFSCLGKDPQAQDA